MIQWKNTVYRLCVEHSPDQPEGVIVPESGLSRWVKGGRKGKLGGAVGEQDDLKDLTATSKSNVVTSPRSEGGGREGMVRMKVQEGKQVDDDERE